VAFAALFTQAELEGRLSASTVRRIFDDANIGTADTNAIAQLIQDASSKVLSWLGPIYDSTTINGSTQAEVQRLALDVAQAMAAQRHPEYVRGDGFKLMEQAERELTNLRKGLTNLGIETPPEPAANQGGDVDSDNPDDDEPQPKVFLGGTGMF
jgi:phage gp36-like protein